MENVIMDYLNSAVALVAMIELFIILRLSARCRRLEAENDIFAKTMELQSRLMERITDRIRVNK